VVLLAYLKPSSKSFTVVATNDCIADTNSHFLFDCMMISSDKVRWEGKVHLVVKICTLGRT
jgi:hypothetical protein